MKVFIVHYKKLVDRKSHVIQELEKHNILNYEFIEIDRDELQNQNISIFEENFQKCQKAIALSHMYAYKQIADKHDQALIFEDDIILSDSFKQQFDKYMNELPHDYDMLFIGNGCNLHIQDSKITPNTYIYEKCLYPTPWGGDGCGRCTDSYVVSKKCAIKMCKYLDNLSYKIKLPVDWWLNVAARDNNFKVYWAEPTIVTQGTQNGLFKSSH